MISKHGTECVLYIKNCNKFSVTGVPISEGVSEMESAQIMECKVESTVTRSFTMVTRNVTMVTSNVTMVTRRKKYQVAKF